MPDVRFGSMPDISGQASCLLWLRLSADGGAKAQKVAVGVLDGEFAETVRKTLWAPFGLAVLLNSGPQCINVVDGEVLSCRCVGLSEMRIVHKHDGNAVTA